MQSLAARGGLLDRPVFVPGLLLPLLLLERYGSTVSFRKKLESELGAKVGLEPEPGWEPGPELTPELDLELNPKLVGVALVSSKELSVSPAFPYPALALRVS